MAPVPYHAGRFPPERIDWARLVPLIGPASAALARYDGLLLAIPNASVLLPPLTTQEAVLSSRIEGTRATMGERSDSKTARNCTQPDKLRCRSNFAIFDRQAVLPIIRKRQRPGNPRRLPA